MKHQEKGIWAETSPGDIWELRLMQRSQEMLTEPGTLISRETASARLRMWAERENARFPKSLRAPRFGAAAGWELLSPGGLRFPGSRAGGHCRAAVSPCPSELRCCLQAVPRRTRCCAMK